MAAKEAPVIDIAEHLREKKLPNLLSPNLPSWLLAKFNIKGVDISSINTEISNHNGNHSVSETSDYLLRRGSASPERHILSTPRSPIPTKPARQLAQSQRNMQHNKSSVSSASRHQIYSTKSSYEVRGKSVIVHLKLRKNKLHGLGIRTEKDKQKEVNDSIFKNKKIHWVNLARNKKHEAEAKRGHNTNSDSYQSTEANGTSPQDLLSVDNNNSENEPSEYCIITYIESITLFLIGFQYEQASNIKLVNFNSLLPLMNFVSSLIENKVAWIEKRKPKSVDSYQYLLGLVAIMRLVTLSAIKKLSLSLNDIDNKELVKLETQLSKLQYQIDRRLPYETLSEKFPKTFQLRAKSIDALMNSSSIGPRPKFNKENLFYLPCNAMNMNVNNAIQFAVNIVQEWCEINSVKYDFSYDGNKK